jgi:hypothetical protein
MIMNNLDVEILLDECQADLDKVKGIIDLIGRTSNIVPYLTKYAIIKSCGSIEVAYKNILADFCGRRARKQVKHFISKRVRESSNNPTYAHMCAFLKEFDVDWNVRFKRNIDAHPEKDKILTSLESLVDARNDFAHGGNPSITIDNIITYYNFSRLAIEIYDHIVS